MGYIYVASPYSHPSFLIRCERYQAVMRYMAKLFTTQRAAYSPIMHWHPASVQFEFPKGFEHWRIQDETMLDGASHLHVLALPGWRDSRGVQNEIHRWKLNFGEPTIIEEAALNVNEQNTTSLSRTES